MRTVRILRPMYSDAEGELAVRMARETIESRVRRQAVPAFSVPASFERESGAFVTVNTYPAEELRGCIGYPSPFFSLVKAIMKAAEGATEDPRFPPLSEAELGAGGVLLAQVAVDWGWDPEEFLSQTCVKAGLLPDAWLDTETRIYRFQSEVWAEVEPRGPIVRRVLDAHARA